MLFGVTPNLSRLKVFGWLCFAKLLHIKHKFDQCARTDIFIGYSFGQKRYGVNDIEIKIIHVSRDIFFLAYFCL